MNRRSFLRGLAAVATTAALGLGLPIRRETETKIVKRLEFDHRGYVIGAEFGTGDIVRVTGSDFTYLGRVVPRNPLTLSAVDRPAP